MKRGRKLYWPGASGLGRISPSINGNGFIIRGHAEAIMDSRSQWAGQTGAMPTLTCLFQNARKPHESGDSTFPWRADRCASRKPDVQHDHGFVQAARQAATSSSTDDYHGAQAEGFGRYQAPITRASAGVPHTIPAPIEGVQAKSDGSLIDGLVDGV